MLNAVLLVVCVCILICIIFYLFYWNRFFAFAFSLILRLLLWNQGESSIWVEVGAFPPMSDSVSGVQTGGLQGRSTSRPSRGVFSSRTSGTTRATRRSE